jgi:signal transduction histidine kinase
MLDSVREWLDPDPDTPGLFRQRFVAAYIGVIGALVLYSNLTNPCLDPLFSGQQWLMLVLLLALPLVERFDLNRFGQSRTRWPAIGMLAVRMGLVQGIVVLDCTGLAVLLYPIIPYAAFFSLGPWVSIVVALFYWCWVAAGAWLLDDSSFFRGLDRVAIIVLFTLIMTFMLVVAHIINRDERSRQQTRQLLDRLATSHRQLQESALQVADLAAAKERNRLAREIHDSVGHHLTAINIQLEKAIAYRMRNPKEADQAIRDAKQSAQEALHDVRHSVTALRKTEEVFSLKEALTDLVSRMNGSSLCIDLNVDGDESGYARPALIALYRAAQEGLTNVQKHAQAQHVTLDLQLGAEEARLHLRDDGEGFNVDDLPLLTHQSEESFGLQGLRERLDLIHGQVIIASDPHQGTNLTVVVPKNALNLTANGVP